MVDTDRGADPDPVVQAEVGGPGQQRVVPLPLSGTVMWSAALLALGLPGGGSPARTRPPVPMGPWSTHYPARLRGRGIGAPVPSADVPARVPRLGVRPRNPSLTGQTPLLEAPELALG